DDGGFSGATLERPGLARLLQAVETREVDCVVVYKVDRLSRSLLDFSRLLSLFERHRVSFVSVTQDFNTTTSMGRLTLNILLSFAQFEREIISERTCDKLSAARRKMLSPQKQKKASAFLPKDMEGACAIIDPWHSIGLTANSR